MGYVLKVDYFVMIAIAVASHLKLNYAYESGTVAINQLLIIGMVWFCRRNVIIRSEWLQ